VAFEPGSAIGGNPRCDCLRGAGTRHAPHWQHPVWMSLIARPHASEHSVAGSPSQRGTRPRIVSTAAGFQCVSGVSSPLMTAVLARIGVLGGLAPRRGSARRTRPRRGVALQFTAVVEARAGRVEVIEPQSRRPKAKLGLLI